MRGPHGPGERHQPITGRVGWDDLYRGDDGEAIWSGRPNPALVAEVSTLEPGKAVDLGCGEGGDAIWLASRGWDVTGIDISSVAIERATRHADRAGARVGWFRADFVEEPPPAGSFDLVTTHYPALLKTRAEQSLPALLSGVAPGGTLLFVTHHLIDHEYARSHGFEPDDYLGTNEVIEALGDSWAIVVDETRPRPSPSGSHPHAEDKVLRARRLR
ncbi:MAG: class I SAM-dependent methyltransferase [Acidimicrobiia bacterium]